MIGSEQKGWTYISKDGALDKWYSNYATGGPSKVGEGYFKTIDDFNKSDFAKEYGGFTYRVRFSSNDQQDKSATDAMRHSANSWYHVGLNNCIDAVSRALEAAGLNPGYNVYGADNSYADPASFSAPRPTQRLNSMKEFNKDREVPLNKQEDKNKNTAIFNLNSFINAVIATGGKVTIK